MAFLPNYNLALARELVAGADVWLNTPLPPLEASGTSGMKAALNGVPSLSVLDGWWVEGCIEGVTGWAIGADGRSTGNPRQSAAGQAGAGGAAAVPPGSGRLDAGDEGGDQQGAALFTSHRMMRRYAAEAYLGRSG